MAGLAPPGGPHRGLCSFSPIEPTLISPHFTSISHLYPDNVSVAHHTRGEGLAFHAEATSDDCVLLPLGQQWHHCRSKPRGNNNVRWPTTP